MKTTYLAVPLLVYVPLDHPFAARGQEYIEGSLADHLRMLSGIRPFLAEDFANSFVTEQPDIDLSARITDICLPVKQSGTNPGFESSRSWETAAEAAKHCFAQPYPIQALADLVTHNLHLDEMGFAADVIKAFPDGPFPDANHPTPLVTPLDPADTLSSASIVLSEELDSSWEHPGVINIIQHGKLFTFDWDEGFFRYGYGPTDGAETYEGSTFLDGQSNHEQLATWIRQEVAKQAEAVIAPSTSHTPGPWVATDNRNVDETLGVHTWDGNEGVNIADIAHAIIPADQALANARLIAAAPQLLAALSRLADYVQIKFENSENFTSSLVLEARQAIAAATA